MTRQQLRDRLKEEAEKYARTLSYAQAVELNTPIVEQHGIISIEDFYQVTVRLLEAVRSESDNYAHLAVAVDDGRGPGIGHLRVITPEVASLIFHSDGRVEKIFRGQ